MFLTNEVICFKDMDNHEIQNALEVYTKSLRAFFSFKICGLGVTCCNSNENFNNLVDKNHWVNVVWPLLAKKVFSLEFFDTVEFVQDILPALLNATQQLQVLKIHNLQYCPYEELYKVKKLQSLKELHLDNFLTYNIDRNKLLGIIPEHLQKICLKSMLDSESIIGDIVNVLSYCSLSLKTLKLINIDVTPALMRSISCLNIKLKHFCLILTNSLHYDHEPEILWPLFKTQWPLISLTLHADCLTNRHFYKIIQTFNDLEILSMSSNETALSINEEVINSLGTLKQFKTQCTLPNSVFLKKIK